ncbi:hypothetical protein BpHYR1_019721 [Brachionus plicatilis]|uniref:Uncharacterized protein n=1 Tax=Brachionus plicatilis TaxID=10195 RepID=A0A3M7PXR1_BRAPC|nr:hypothetical protein BpHYR1_019721 [Brachionus plicatilis]
MLSITAMKLLAMKNYAMKRSSAVITGTSLASTDVYCNIVHDNLEPGTDTTSEIYTLFDLAV